MSPELQPLSALIRRARRRLQEPLPGLTAQRVLAPRPRDGWTPGLPAPESARRAAGLVLLYPHRRQPHLLLTLRRHDLEDHAGQVSLPGGAMEPGETAVQAALREAHEEVGLDPRMVEILGPLTPLHIPASGFLLQPIVAGVRAEPRLRASDAEVERIVQVPLRQLSDPRNLKVESWRLNERDITVPSFRVEDLAVWGATAMVLAELLTLLGLPPDPWTRTGASEPRNGSLATRPPGDKR